MEYEVYTTKICPRCAELKEILKSKGVEYLERDLADPENLAELRINGVFTLMAPVLKIGDDFYTEDQALFQAQLIGF